MPATVSANDALCASANIRTLSIRLRGICTCRIRPHLAHLAVNTVATSHSRLVFAVPNSHYLMGHAERLHQNQSREGQEAHAPFYVQYEVIEKTFQQSEHADASVFTDMIKGEIEKVTRTSSPASGCWNLRRLLPIPSSCAAPLSAAVWSPSSTATARGCVRSSRSSRRRRRCAVRPGGAAHA